MSKEETRTRSEERLELVGLKREGGRRIGGYSRGMRQRLGTAQALMNRPKVLFLDEPTSAQSPVGKREVLNLIKKLKPTSTVFMSTHNLNEGERVCDTVGIINRGRLLTISSVEQLQKKYARSLFEMEFLEGASPFLETLRQTSWLTEPETISQNGVPVIRVKARDLDYARPEFITGSVFNFLPGTDTLLLQHF